MWKDIFKKGLIVGLSLLVLIFGITTGNAVDQKVQTADEVEQSAQVKLPDGLYLFQPKIIQMYKHSPEIKDDIFSPLFVVEKGKLVDPYPLAKKMGMQKFMKEYVTGKTFNVYVGTEMVGKLSNVKLKFFETNTCPSGTFLFDIVGSGKYEGKPLPGRYVDKSVYAHNNEKLFLNLSTVKALATPQSFNKSKKMKMFVVTEDDKTKAIKDVRKNLVSEDIKAIEKWSIEKKKITSEKGRERLDFIKAIDLDNNERKDFVGVYDLSLTDRKETEHGDAGFGSMHVRFILWDTGKIKSFTSVEGIDPSFSFGGIIDINNDGIQELIVQVNSSPADEHDIGRKRIEILQHDSSGWKSIYRSEWICNQIY